MNGINIIRIAVLCCCCIELLGLTWINGPSHAAVPVVFDAGEKTNECVPTERTPCLVNTLPRDRLLQSCRINIYVIQ